MKKSKKQKEFEYAQLIIIKIYELLESDTDSDIKIENEELKDEKNLTHFFQALSNIAPNFIFNKITGKNLNNLEFNHLANQLVFQYLNKEKEV